MSKSLFLKPRMSEKAYSLSEERNTYVFDIPARAKKQAVAEAVAAQYKVTVETVRIAKAAPKNRRIVKRRGRNVYRGQSSGRHKAYVRLAKDQSLPIFAAVKEEEEKEAKLAAKTEKLAEKQKTKVEKASVSVAEDKKSDEPIVKPRRHFWRHK